MITLHSHAEKHPLTIGRPCGRSAVPFGTYLTPGGTAVQRNQAAWLPDRIHLNDQCPLPVRRGVGQMCHATLVLGKVDRSVFGPVFRGSHNTHMLSPFHFREQDPVLIQPGESGSVCYYNTAATTE